MEDCLIFFHRQYQNSRDFSHSAWSLAASSCSSSVGHEVRGREEGCEVMIMFYSRLVVQQTYRPPGDWTTQPWQTAPSSSSYYQWRWVPLLGHNVTPWPPDWCTGVVGGLCPLCRRRRLGHTVAPVSGILFCYSCIVLQVRQHQACPVTGLPLREEDLVRVFPPGEE